MGTFERLVTAASSACLLPTLALAVPQGDLVVSTGDDGASVPPTTTQPATTTQTVLKTCHHRVGAEVLFPPWFPIQSGFFGPGSDPWTGAIALEGAQLQTVPPDSLPSVNVLLRRYADTAPLAVGAADTVPTGLVALHLESVDPIVVSFNGGTSFEEFDVDVTLSRTVPQPAGSATIVRDQQYGGWFEYDLSAMLALDFSQGRAVVATFDPYGPVDLHTEESSWLSEGGSSPFSRTAIGIEPLPAGIQVDGDGDGAMDYTTVGCSNFQLGVCVRCDGLFDTSPVELTATTPGECHLDVYPAGDADGDEVYNRADNCPIVANRSQWDTDADLIGDACDPTPEDASRPHFNELYVAQLGADDQEFLELIGPPGWSLAGCMVLIVDGDGTTAGYLEQALDLSQEQIEPDGFFVIGDNAVPGVDLVLGAQDVFDNGTQTLYLIQTSNPAAWTPLVGIDLDPDGDRRTSIPCDTDEIYDRVALWDGDAADRTYDDAWKYLLGDLDDHVPPGIYRAGGGPSHLSPWCPGAFLDFDAGANSDMPRTPGAVNSPCPFVFGPGEGYCFGDPGFGAPCPCGNDNDSSLPGSGCDNGSFASGARLSASGTASISSDTLVLMTTHLEPSNAGLYFQANNDLSPGIPWGDGLQCAGGQLRRLGVRFANATGYSDTSAWSTPISVKAGNVNAGDTKRYQCWYRTTIDPPCGVGVNDFNASNGYAVTWLP